MDASIKKLLISYVFSISMLLTFIHNPTTLAFEKYIESQSFGLDAKIKISSRVTRLKYVVAEFFVRGENGERFFLPQHPRLIPRGENLTIPFGIGARLHGEGEGEGEEEINEITVRYRPTESLLKIGGSIINPDPEPSTQEHLNG